MAIAYRAVVTKVGRISRQTAQLDGAAIKVGGSQYHLAIAGGCEALRSIVKEGFAPTRYREVVLTASNYEPKLLAHSLNSQLESARLSNAQIR